jgi:hypothetical protein
LRGKPRLPRSRRSPKSVAVVCISRTSCVRNFLIPSLCVGIVTHSGPSSWAAPLFPLKRLRCLRNSYGGSVAMSLATGRRSRIYAHETFRAFRCPVRFLPPFLAGYSLERTFGARRGEAPIPVSSLQVCCDGCAFSPLETRIQPV